MHTYTNDKFVILVNFRLFHNHEGNHQGDFEGFTENNDLSSGQLSAIQPGSLKCCTSIVTVMSDIVSQHVCTRF